MDHKTRMKEVQGEITNHRTNSMAGNSGRKIKSTIVDDAVAKLTNVKSFTAISPVFSFGPR